MNEHELILNPTIEEILNIEQDIYKRIEAGGKLKILIAILIFSVIIIFHELGHFLLAKRNGIKVTEFSLGMGPRLLSTQKEKPVIL